MSNSAFWNGIIADHASAALIAERVTKAVTPKRTYRGWDIRPDYVGWTATSQNYDASYEGPEDGWVDNGEKSWGRTREECEAGVDEWFDENGCPDCDGDGRAWNNCDPTSGQWVDCECQP